VFNELTYDSNKLTN